jgi:hypothetical protein
MRGRREGGGGEVESCGIPGSIYCWPPPGNKCIAIFGLTTITKNYNIKYIYRIAIYCKHNILNPSYGGERIFFFYS